VRGLLLTLIVVLLVASTTAETFTSQVTIRVLDAAGRRLTCDEYKPLVRLEGYGYARECSGHECSFNVQVTSNESSLSFNLTVYWLGTRVYKGALLLTNGSSKTVEVKVNATKVKLLGVDDGGRRVDSCKLEVEGAAKLTLECGVTVSLPFGTYRVRSAELLIADRYVPVGVEDEEFEVTSDSAEVRVGLEVASSVTLRIVKLDGSPLTNGTLKLMFLDAEEPVSVYEGPIEGGAVTLRDLPYGEYLAEVYWSGLRLLSENVEVGPSSATITLTTSLLPRAQLRLLDADGYPLANTPIQVEGAGLKMIVVTDEGGWASLSDVLPGFYNVSIRWLNRAISAPVYIGEGGSATVRMPLRALKVVLAPKMASDLPSGLRAELLYEPEGYVLAEASLNAPSPQLILSPQMPIPLDVSLKLVVHWGDRLLLEGVVDPYSRVRYVNLSFIDLEVEVVDASGNPLPGAMLRVEDALGVREVEADQYGRVLLKHLYGERFEVEAIWRRIPVARESAAFKRKIVVKAYVYDLRVVVRGAIGQPVAGALVSVSVSGPGFSLEANATAGSDGLAEIRWLPAPPGSTLVLRVAKGRVELVKPLTPTDLEEGVIEVRLDLLIDYGWLQLRVSEFIVLVAVATLSIAAAALVYRALRVRLAAMKVLSEYRVEWEAAPSSFWDRLRARIRAVLGSEEEEEEGELFEEL